MWSTEGPVLRGRLSPEVHFTHMRAHTRGRGKMQTPLSPCPQRQMADLPHLGSFCCPPRAGLSARGWPLHPEAHGACILLPSQGKVLGPLDASHVAV